MVHKVEKDIFSKILPKLRIIRLAKTLRFNREIYFPFIISYISKLFRGNVDDKLIVLGGSGGKAFIGNTKYLYFFLKEHTDYKLVYFVQSQELQKQLNKLGVKTVKAYSLEAIKILRKARFIFVTHGVTDVLPISFSPRTVFIQTWHGQDIKLLNVNINKSIRYTIWPKLLGLKLRNDDVYDILITPSGALRPKKILADAMKVPLKKIVTTGYPRNDIFFSKDLNLKEKLRSLYNIPVDVQHIILYAPTFREDYKFSFPLSNDELMDLDRLCQETHSLFLIKGHINEKWEGFKNFENIKIVKKDSDTQELLAITDVLISDYSSIYIDFMLLNRPILLFVYDYDKYLKTRGIYYSHLDEIAPGPLIYSGKELIEAIKNIKEIETKYELKYKQLNDYFNKYKDGNSSERLLRYLKIIK